MIAREKVAEAIRLRATFGPYLDWFKETPESLADAAIAAHLEALKADGYTVIRLPEVAHKGPRCTDAKFFRQVADRMDDPTRRIDYLSGSNVRNAVRELLYRAADASEGIR
ncbi:hypothetical protein [Mycolicibacterium setense]